MYSSARPSYVRSIKTMASTYYGLCNFNALTTPNDVFVGNQKGTAEVLLPYGPSCGAESGLTAPLFESQPSASCDGPELVCLSRAPCPTRICSSRRPGQWPLLHGW